MRPRLPSPVRPFDIVPGLVVDGCKLLFSRPQGDTVMNGVLARQIFVADQTDGAMALSLYPLSSTDLGNERALAPKA
jgi:hypothetical protein